MVQNSPSHDDRNWRSNSSVLTDDRGISDTLAFVLTFSIIITSVGVVYGFGFASLSDIRDDQTEANAQHAFEGIGDDINDIRDTGVPKRSKRIELRGGTIATDTSSQISIEINKTTPAYSGSLGTLTYQLDETTTIGYEGGATFRSESTNSVMHTAPSFQCFENPNKSVISIVVLKDTTPSSVSSSGTISVVATKVKQTLEYPKNLSSTIDVDNVTVTVTGSPYQEAWNREFTERSAWTVSGNSYTCNTEQVYIRVTEIKITYEE
jgi:hypothetical protein